MTKRLCCSDADIYDSDNLKEHDKKALDLLLDSSEELFSEQKVNEYLRELEFGKNTKEMIKEFLLPFIEYLKDEAYRMSIEFLIKTIDDYSEEDYKSIIELHKKKENE